MLTAHKPHTPGYADDTNAPDRELLIIEGARCHAKVQLWRCHLTRQDPDEFIADVQRIAWEIYHARPYLKTGAILRFAVRQMMRDAFRAGLKRAHYLEAARKRSVRTQLTPGKWAALREWMDALPVSDRPIAELFAQGFTERRAAKALNLDHADIVAARDRMLNSWQSN